MEYPKIKQFEMDRNTDTVLLLLSSEEKTTTGGGSYLRHRMTDGEQFIDVNQWKMTIDSFHVPANTLIGVRIYTKMYNGQMSYELKSCGQAPEGVDKSDFIVSAPWDADKMYNNILATVRSGCKGGSPCLADLVETIYENNKEKMMYWAAAKSVHHNYHAGLLYHTERMLRQAYFLSKVYELDTELLFAGVALHDIGKLVELDTSDIGSADYTVKGNLFGHALLGIMMIDEAAKEKEYTPEKIMLLKHLIASHHGQLDWGAIATPCVKEAYALHYIDHLDAVMEQCEATLKGLEPGKMSDKVFGLNSRVYCPDYN